MKIAILGTRGIPAAYGGFETFAEELSTRLAARGHQVWVYCRPHAVSTRTAEYRGVRLVFLPSIRHKYFDTVTHTLFSVLHLMLRLRHAEVALICNAANSAVAWMPRLCGVRVALNVDGLERLRRKWNVFGRAWYRLGEWLATWTSNALVTDAASIQRYYVQRYRTPSTFIPYGASPPRNCGTDVLDRLGLEPRRYLLYVSRLEPENNALLVARAFQSVDAPVKLALVGDAPYAADYIREVRDSHDPRILMPGAVYGDGYSQLRAHALAYIHATEVGGTHPALIEAMAAGLPCVYLDTPENREVAGDAGVSFQRSESDLTAKIQALLKDAPERARLGEAARQRARTRYDWEEVTTEYERLFAALTR